LTDILDVPLLEVTNRNVNLGLLDQSVPGRVIEEGATWIGLV
jgi:hypothetical protein